MSDKFIEKYLEFIEQLVIFFPDKNGINDFFSKIKLDNDYIINIGKKYYDIINKEKIYKRYLLEKKNKLFVLEKNLILPENNFKNLINSLDQENQNIIWEYLQVFYLLLDTSDDKYKNKLIKSMNNKNNNLADDIFNDIKNTINPNNIDPNNLDFGNIFGKAMELAGKYGDKFESGQVTFNDMLNTVKKAGGDNEQINNLFNGLMDEKGNLNINNIMNNSEMGDLGNMVSGLMGGGLFDNLLGNTKKNEPVKELSEKEKQELVDYYSKLDMDELTNIMKNVEKNKK